MLSPWALLEITLDKFNLYFASVSSDIHPSIHPPIQISPSGQICEANKQTLQTIVLIQTLVLPTHFL